MKFFYCDVETTGVDYKIHGIHQIAGMIEIDGKIVETFNFNVKPHPDAVILDEALAVSGVTREQLATYPEMDVIYNKLVGILGKYINKYDKNDKAFFVAYNASFDYHFMRQFFDDNADKYFGSWFWSNFIDAMTLAGRMLLNERPSMVNFKLMTVASKLGIVIDQSKAHDAIYDISITKQICDMAGVQNNKEDKPDISTTDVDALVKQALK